MITPTMHDLPLTNTDVASRTPSLHSHLLKEQDVDAEIVASMAYQATTLAEGTEVVQGVFARILEDPATAKLRYDRESDEFMESSSTTSANDTLTTRASVPHFVDLVHDREVHELVRVTSWVTRSEYGHLVAVGPDGFPPLHMPQAAGLRAGLPTRHHRHVQQTGELQRGIGTSPLA